GQALISGGTGAPTFYAPTAGSILFAGTSGILQQDNANFFWDDSTNRLGIGTAAPTTLFEIYGSGADVVSTITAADATYDPILKFRTGASPAIQFSLGIDNSDSDKFKIFSGDGLGSGDEFVIDASGVTTIANLNLGAATFDTDAGIVSWIDMPVTSAASAGTIESYTAQIDNNPLLTVYAESDGAGSIQNSAVGIGMATPIAKLDITQSATTATASTGYYGLRSTVTDSGVVITGTDTDYGTYTSLTRTGATTSGATAINTYGNYTTLSHTGAASGTVNAYGSYTTATGSTGGTSTLYGNYVTATGADTTYGLYSTVTAASSTTAYALYADAGAGAGTEYTAAFMNGNVGIGTATPGSKLVVTGTGTTSGDFKNTGTGATQYGLNAEATGASTLNIAGYFWSSGASANYGIQLGVGAAANNYSIYASGGAQSYFAGNVGIGDTTPDGTLDLDLTSTSTTGASEYGGNFTVSDTGVVTSGTDVTYGQSTLVTHTGQTGGVIATYGNYTRMTTDNAGSGTSTAYGLYIYDWGANISGTNADENFGIYINTAATASTTTYGIYANVGTGAGTEYSGVFLNGNFGIGTSSPGTLLEIGSSDLGDGVAGPVITLGRNTNGTNTGAGSINIMSKAGTAGYVWQDNTGMLRINTAAPTNANDVAGTVIGTQASSLASKDLVGQFTDNAAALSAIIDAPLYNFTYKSGAYNNQEFTGIITDYSPIFGMDKDTEHPNGKSLNMITAIGYTFGAIKELSQNFVEKNTQNDTLIADISLKTDRNITTLAELQDSVDTQLTVAGTELTTLAAKGAATDDVLALHTAQFLTDETRLTALETLTDQLQLDINAQASKTALLETQMQSLVDFYTTFDLGNLVAKDAAGNIDLTVDVLGNPILLGGKLKAAVLETGALVINVIDPLAPTIGTAEIFPVAVDADSDGNDDFTSKPMTDPEVMARDGQFVQIITQAMRPMIQGSRIFTTFKGNPNGFTWVEKTKDENHDYVGFKIRLSQPVTAPVKVDWLLIEQNDSTP
ncbi:MAG: hypothetical protein WAV46_00370, partial [Candidatus Moraniibacteriota bacterium]